MLLAETKDIVVCFASLCILPLGICAVCGSVITLVIREGIQVSALATDCFLTHYVLKRHNVSELQHLFVSKD